MRNSNATYPHLICILIFNLFSKIFKTFPGMFHRYVIQDIFMDSSFSVVGFPTQPKTLKIFYTGKN